MNQYSCDELMKWMSIYFMITNIIKCVVIWQSSLVCSRRSEKKKRVNEEDSLDDTSREKLLEEIMKHVH